MPDMRYPISAQGLEMPLDLDWVAAQIAEHGAVDLLSGTAPYAWVAQSVNRTTGLIRGWGSTKPRYGDPRYGLVAYVGPRRPVPPVPVPLVPVPLVPVPLVPVPSALDPVTIIRDPSLLTDEVQALAAKPFTTPMGLPPEQVPLSEGSLAVLHAWQRTVEDRVEDLLARQARTEERQARIEARLGLE